jgi:hypothetical protein
VRNALKSSLKGSITLSLYSVIFLFTTFIVFGSLLDSLAADQLSIYCTFTLLYSSKTYKKKKKFTREKLCLSFA